MSEDYSSAKLYSPSASVIWAFGPADIICNEIKQLYEYWLSIGGDAGIPSRTELNILEVKYALGNIVIFEETDDGRFRYRLIGSKVVQRDGFDWTGRYIDTLPVKEYRELILGRVAELKKRQKPLLVRNRHMFDNRWYDYECLWLPLRGASQAVNLFWSCQIHFEAPPDAS